MRASSSTSSTAEKPLSCACRSLRRKTPFRGNNPSVIAHLRGKLISKHPGQAVVEAAGVGYDVVISVPTFTALPATGAEVALHVHTHVREDSLSLFGFSTNDEKRLFERL